MKTSDKLSSKEVFSRNIHLSNIHKSELDKLPKILLLSKIDSMNEPEFFKQKLPNELKTLKISSLSGKNLEKAIKSIAYLVES